MAPFWGENQLVQKHKKELKWRAPVLKNQDASRVQTQGLNFVQMSPKWFLGIWALELHLK
jgi:hypothetical protein